MLNPFTLATFSKEKHDYMSSFDVERWYDAIKAHTFSTDFIPLTKEEAEVMVRHYQVFQLRNKVEWTDEHQRILDNAIAKLQTCIQKYSSAFVRISTRSPKDAGLAGDDIFKILVLDELAQITKRNGKNPADPPDPNTKLIAVYAVSSKQLEVKNADQAMKLLLESERIYSDLRHALEHDVDWQMKFIVREFVPLDPSYEFRGFVCNKVLTALAQYNNTCFYPHLQDHEQEIVDRIVNFYKSICKDVPFDSCIVDFVIIGDQIKVVEINPFGPMTGAPLFSWQNERHILQGGEDIFEDNFGQPENKTAQSTTDNTNDESKDPVEEAPPPLWIEVQTTCEPFPPKNWKTVCRIMRRTPTFVTENYVESMFPGLFSTENTAEKETKKEDKCVLQ